MSLRWASDIPIKVLGNRVLFVQLDDLYVQVHLGVVDNHSMPLLVGTSCIDRFLKGIISTNVASSRSGLAQSQLLANTRHHLIRWLPYRLTRIGLEFLDRRLTGQQQLDTSVSGCKVRHDFAKYWCTCINHDHQRKFDVPYVHGATPEIDRNPNGPFDLRGWNGQWHVPTLMQISNRAKKADNIIQNMVIWVRTDLWDYIVHSDQAAINPDDKRGEKEDKSVTDIVAAIR